MLFAIDFVVSLGGERASMIVSKIMGELQKIWKKLEKVCNEGW